MLRDYCFLAVLIGFAGVGLCDSLLQRILPRAYVTSEKLPGFLSLWAAKMTRGLFPGFFYPTGELYQYEVTALEIPPQMSPGHKGEVRVRVKNAGREKWHGSDSHPIRLGTSYPPDHFSIFYTPESWICENRALSLEQAAVWPGQSVELCFEITAPSEKGSYSECFSLVSEGEDWFCGGPIAFTIQVE
jgi:hypothetical protein